MKSFSIEEDLQLKLVTDFFFFNIVTVMTSDGESFSQAVTSETSDLFIFLVHPYSVIGYLSIFYQESLCERMKYILKYIDTVRLKFHPLIFPVFPSKNTERSHLQLHLETTHCFFLVFFFFCSDSSQQPVFFLHRLRCNINRGQGSQEPYYCSET